MNKSPFLTIISIRAILDLTCESVKYERGCFILDGYAYNVSFVFVCNGIQSRVLYDITDKGNIKSQCSVLATDVVRIPE